MTTVVSLSRMSRLASGCSAIQRFPASVFFLDEPPTM